MRPSDSVPRPARRPVDRRRLGQADESIAALGVGRRLDATGRAGVPGPIDFGVERQTGDGSAGVLVADDPFDGFRRCDGVLELTGMDDLRRVLAHLTADDPHLGSVAAHGVGFGVGGDRRARDGKGGDPIPPDPGQLESTVGSGPRGGDG